MSMMMIGSGKSISGPPQEGLPGNQRRKTTHLRRFSAVHCNDAMSLIPTRKIFPQLPAMHAWHRSSWWSWGCQSSFLSQRKWFYQTKIVQIWINIVIPYFKSMFWSSSWLNWCMSVCHWGDIGLTAAIEPSRGAPSAPKICPLNLLNQKFTHAFLSFDLFALESVLALLFSGECFYSFLS